MAMAHVRQLPCNGDGVCMVCKEKPSEEENLTCKTCLSSWHAPCLCNPPSSLAHIPLWVCPDCDSDASARVLPFSAADAFLDDGSGEMIAAIRAIEADPSLTEQDKARKRQQLMSRKAKSENVKKNDDDDDDDDAVEKKEMETEKEKEKDVLDILSGTLCCSFCMQLPERPVTTPCGHTFCLKCFQKWIGQGKRTCAKCRRTIPPKMASQPRINSALVVAIRMARVSKNMAAGGPSRVYHFVHNQDKPNQAYATDRSQRNGLANAASGKIFVTVPQDHFGPIPAENDPVRNQGLLVGECWSNRQECRQWGAHFPTISGIAGQSKHGAQSVVLSGGYVDDEDHGEWFLYTGSGGRDLSGNRRTNNKQSFDQKFEKFNLALQVSCLKGYPVRVVRSHKDKHSSYAPESGVRYDGVYRIEKCWQKVGLQGFKVCRYLFVRCDNEPAPWTTDDHGDRPRPLPAIRELKKATDVTERKESPSWNFDEEDSCWKWKKPPPPSKCKVENKEPKEIKRSRKEIKKYQSITSKERLLKEFACLICKQVMVSPVTTPCAHNFCKSCLKGVFAGQSYVRDRSRGGRSLRTQKNVMKCPACPVDISDYLQNLEVNREIMNVIEKLKAEAEENGDSESMESSEEDCAAKDEEDTGSENTDSAEELNDSPEESNVIAVKGNAKRKGAYCGQELAEMGNANKAKT